jgi:hypothetical protein
VQCTIISKIGARNSRICHESQNFDVLVAMD